MTNILNSVVGNISDDYSKVGKINTFGSIAAVIANFITGIGFFASFIGIAYALILFVISQGDKYALQKAKSALTWSLVAAFVTMFAWVLKNILFGLLGVKLEIYNEVPNF